jgi:hypothetical protein
MNYDFIIELKKSVEESNQLYHSLNKSLENYFERKNGKNYSFSEHMKVVIYSLLSNQRPWKPIEENKDKIDKIFFDYDVEKIKYTNPKYFVTELRKISCGNRNIQKQMGGLKNVILVLENIEKENGTIDSYYNNHEEMKRGYPYYLAKELSNRDNKFKLKNMGIALICEYFKNIGIDIAKPDTHIRRMLGKNILGFSKNVEATPKEAINYIKEIAEKNKISQKEVDALIWLYCADGYGAICTKENPKCYTCVIKIYCNKNKLKSKPNGT